MSDGHDQIRDAVAGAGVVAPPDGPPEGTFDGDLDGICGWQPQNDYGNGQRLVRRHGEDLIHVRDHGWYGWDGRRWDRERGPVMTQRLAHRTLQAIRDEAAALEHGSAADKDRAGRLKTWAKDSGSSGHIGAMQKEAVPYLMRESDELDRHADLLNAANGTVELGVRCNLRPFDRADLLTHVADVPFEDGAEALVFENFVHTILPDRATRAFVQRWFGYCLTGHTREQVVVMFLGLGSNGKSTLLHAISSTISDLHLTLPISTFGYDHRRRGSEATPDMARLPGVRMVTTSEPEIGMTLSESRIKELTGGEEISVRHLNQGFFEFQPQCKVTMSFNNRPKVRGQDKGTWRRFLLVPFEVTVGPDEVGPVFGHLEAERAGILRWLLDGAEQWYEGGLQVPAAIADATSQFRSEQDPLSQFLDDMCVAGEAEAASSVLFKDLYAVYEAWCKDQREEAITGNLFGRKLQERGFKKNTAGDRAYSGLRLNEQARAVAEKARSSGRSDDPPGDPERRG